MFWLLHHPLPLSLIYLYISHWKGVEGAKEKNGTANKQKTF